MISINELTDHAVRILDNGPNRVLINNEGEAIAPSRAKARGIEPDMIFIREDGWSLGTPKKFRYAAAAMWSEEWIGLINIRTMTIDPYPGVKTTEGEAAS